MNYTELYSKNIISDLETGTERTLYKPLGNFLEEFINDKYKRKVSTNAEQSSKNYDQSEKRVGFPDIVLKENDFSIGYIEVKLPSDSLEKKDFKEQFSKYKESLDNIIFTNLKTWELWQWTPSAKPKKIKAIIFDYLNPDLNSLQELFDLFLAYQSIQAKTAKQLAINLAKKTKLLSQKLQELLNEQNQDLLNIKEAFTKSVLNDIKDKSLANLIAETFTYSLFIATLEQYEKNKQNEQLTLTTARDYIPKTVPVIHDLYNLADNLSRSINDIRDIVELILKELNSCDIAKISKSFHLSIDNKDPIIHFYEPFLDAYDPETKKERGCFYTPKPAVDFIVRNVNSILEQEFGLELGLANEQVKLLDPATGTGTFLASTIELSHQIIQDNYQALGLDQEKFKELVLKHILKNYYGFEFMIAPYAVAHLKLTYLLKSLGFDFELTFQDGDPDNDRFHIYIANTLDDPDKEPLKLFTLKHLTEESQKAQSIKNQKDIIAIIGNPPYSGSSQNPSQECNSKGKKQLTWIGEQIENYKYLNTPDGKIKLDEKNPKWLQDDYVKFIRFAQYQIEQKGSGVIGYIVNHSFIDNPTFRYMRKSLMDTFDKIYILDLHGNNKKKETCPDGSKDENIFKIEQGVAIVLLIKTDNSSNNCEIFHGDLYGLAKDKLSTLESNTIQSLCTNKLTPKSEMYYFIPRDTELEDEYSQFWSVRDIFQLSNTGIVSKRDSIVFHKDKNKLNNILLDFKDLEEQELRNKHNISPDSRDWKVSYAKKAVETFDIKEEYILQADYRPFDTRWTYYINKSKGFMAYPVYDVMQHMLEENTGLVLYRFQYKASEPFTCSFISNRIIDINSLQSPGGACIFPLYLYNTNEDQTKLNINQAQRKTNFTEKFRKYKDKELKRYTDEQIFYYIYGLLHSNEYRARYDEFLKRDFPRIDLSHNILEISKLGQEISELHLLKHNILKQQSQWNIKKEGDSLSVNYKRKADIWQDNKIYLNETTYIEGVASEIYEFKVGGYQVLEKWLTDRKDTELTIDELLHYMKVIISLRETIRLMSEIDGVIKL